MVLNLFITYRYKLFIGLALTSLTFAAKPAQAVVIHRYLLDGNTNDSVGTLHLSAVDDFPPDFVADNKAGGQSAEFTGINAVLGDVPVGDPLRTSVFSLAFWMKYGTQPSGYGMPIGRADGSNTPWVVQINPSGSITWIPQGVDGGQFSGINTGGGDSDPWHHVVLSQNHNLTSIFVDGVPIRENATTAAPSITDSKPLRLGRRGDGFLFAGRLDDIQIYDDPLSASDAAYLHSHPGETIVPVKPLELQVNRVTGETILRNPSSNSSYVELISYTLSSNSNPLESSNDRWKSFQDAGKPGVFEANPSTSNLSELASGAPVRLMPGESHNFGTPFTVNESAPLGTSRVNLADTTFKYQLPDGTEILVRREDVRFNNLVLVVNPTTGFATLQNQSTQSIEMISYTISSASGALLSSYAGSGQPGWFTANPTANKLSELSSGSPIVLNVGDELDLGLAWSTAGQPDLTFVFQDPDNGNLLPGTVHFGATLDIAPGLSGDFNGDGKVDAADYVVWRKTNGSAQGYDLWRTNFGRTSGSGASLSGADTSAVPEPSAIALIVLVGIAGVTLRPAKQLLR